MNQVACAVWATDSANVTMNLPLPLTLPGAFDNCSIGHIKARSDLNESCFNAAYAYATKYLFLLYTTNLFRCPPFASPVNNVALSAHAGKTGGGGRSWGPDSHIIQTPPSTRKSITRRDCIKVAETQRQWTAREQRSRLVYTVSIVVPFSGSAIPTTHGQKKYTIFLIRDFVFSKKSQRRPSKKSALTANFSNSSLHCLQPFKI